MVQIIKWNKWSVQEREKLAAEIIRFAFNATDALGFDCLVVKENGKRVAGIKVRKQGFDIPTASAEVANLHAVCERTLDSLGWQRKNKEKKDERHEKQVVSPDNSGSDNGSSTQGTKEDAGRNGIDNAQGNAGGCKESGAPA